MKEALKLALEALEEAWYHVGTFQPTEKAIDLYDEARTAIKEALAHTNVDADDTSLERVDKADENVHEPVAWMFQHEETGRTVCIDAQQLGWGFEKGNPRLKKIAPLYTTPPQRTERPVDCERCNRLEEQAYDLVGKLRVANIKLSMQPQRTWVGLTYEEITELHHEIKVWLMGTYKTEDIYRAIEAKLRSKNNG